jgi:hypothetical protein
MNVTFLSPAEAPKLSKVKYVGLNGVDYPIFYMQQKYTEHAKELFVEHHGISEWEAYYKAALVQMVAKEVEKIAVEKQKADSYIDAPLPLEALCAYVIVNPLPPVIMVDFDPSLHTDRLTIIPWVDGVDFPKADAKLPRQVWMLDHCIFTSMDEGAFPNTGDVVVPVGVPNKNGDVIPLGVFDHSKYGTGPSDDWLAEQVHPVSEKDFQQQYMNQPVEPLPQQVNPEDLPDIAHFEKKMLESMGIPKDLIMGPQDVAKHYGAPLPPKAMKVWKQVQKAANFALMYGVSGAALKKLIQQKIDAAPAPHESGHVDAFTGAPHPACLFTGAPHPTKTKEQELRENLARYGFKMAGKI